MSKFKVVLILSICIGFFFRAYQFRERFYYNHDHDLSAWIFKDIYIDKHPRLIGQLTSSPGIFIGPLFYYSIIPFFLISNMDPIGTVAYSWIVGMVAIYSIWFVVSRVHTGKAASIASLLYAASWGIVINEREVVPTTPVMLWGIWFYYFLNRLWQKHPDSLLGFAVLFSLIWHLNLALVLGIPIIILGVLANRKIFSPKIILASLVLFITLSIPLVLFEYKHGFIQTKSLLQTFSSTKDAVVPDHFAKFLRVGDYIARNINALYWWGNPLQVSRLILPTVLSLGFITLGLRKKIPNYIFLSIPIWILSYFIFFTLHSINLSEYYLNGLNPVWIIVGSLLLATIAEIKIGKLLVAIAVASFLFTNTKSFLVHPINQSGYIERKSIAEYIAKDSRDQGYPCISISYITTPGNNLGYRYWFYLNKLHVNQPSSGSPVYTIVFPHSLVDRIDKSFGALGLILPDYSKYNEADIKESCSGENSNLTDSMFGFTK